VHQLFMLRLHPQVDPPDARLVRIPAPISDPQTFAWLSLFRPTVGENWAKDVDAMQEKRRQGPCGAGHGSYNGIALDHRCASRGEQTLQSRRHDS
jgi:hypothetical protein